MICELLLHTKRSTTQHHSKKSGDGKGRVTNEQTYQRPPGGNLRK
jgi:hypothetical protein